MIDPAGKSHHRPVIALAARYLLVASMAVLAVALLHYHISRHIEGTKRDTVEQLNVDLGRQAIERILAGVATDLRYLAEDGESRGLFDPAVPGQFAALGESFRIFARQKHTYDQVRYIDLNGKERVRVNFGGGAAAVVAEAELQDKVDRYYFRDSVSLKPGEVYVSPLDLNVERGEIELPHKPMIRFSTPVRDRQGKKSGVLIFNFVGETLLHAFRTAVANIGDHAMLLNGGGYWLSSPNRGEEWGFMLGHRRSFAGAHAEAWQRIVAQDAGQFALSDGIYTFATILPGHSAMAEQVGMEGEMPSGAKQEGWKIVSHISAKRLATAPLDFLDSYLWLYVLLGLLAGVAATFIAQITFHHRRAEAQVVFEQRFREILENIPLFALGLDREGRIVFANDTLCAVTGRSREDLIGRDWAESLVAEEHCEQSRSMFADAVFSTKPRPRHECLLRTSSGGKRLIAWVTARLTDEEGAVVGITCIGDDITEAQEAEESLRKVIRAVEQTPSVVMITDVRGAIEYVNPKFTLLTGYTLDEVRGRNPHILKSGETDPKEYAKLWKTIQSGGEWRGVFHNRKKNGDLYWESACISPIRDASGAITHLLAVKEDITERRRLEREVEQRKHDATRNQALAEVGRMANMVAHDLRNPLSSVKMTLQIYGRRPAKRWTAEERELQKIAIDQVRYMEEILSDLLTYSRPDSLEPEWLSIERVLDAATLAVQKLVEEHGVKVTTRYQPGLPTMLADPSKLRQVFVNLLENAVQATERVCDRAPEIEIATSLELKADGPWIRVDICDNGTGLAPSHEERAFEPFYTTRARGTGLGLAIVRRLVELHGGSVSLDQPGRYRTCATTLLPTRSKAVTADDSPDGEEPIVETGSAQ